MKKKYGLFVILICLSVLNSCQNKEKKVKSAGNELVKTDSTNEIKSSDTLNLKPGDVPKGWEKIKLWEDGYYIAFPKKPRRKIIYSKNRIEFHYPGRNYDAYASITDLSTETAFNSTKAQKKIFYEAVLRDLTEDMSSDEYGIPEVLNKEEFLSLNIYEALRAELKAKDLHVFFETVLIGKMLYTMAFVLSGEENKSLTDIKFKFFNSFGKDLKVE